MLQSKTKGKIKTANGSKKSRVLSELKVNWQLYVMIILPLLYILIFKYGPMYGARMAFLNYMPNKGYSGSEFVGFDNFIRFFKSPQFWSLIKNTLALSIYSLILSIPFPIILAISLNYLKNQKFKKTVQMVTYMPYFLSTVIIVGMLQLVFNMQSGVVNNIIAFFGGEKINFMGLSKYFRSMYVWSGVWQGTGWGSIMYIAALAGVDPQLHEAAIIDGANKVRRVWHIDLPCIAPTVAIMTIMNMGSILQVGFDKTFLMQNPTNLEISEVLSTYEYKIGLGGGIPSYPYPAAIGLFASIVTFIMVTVSNKISRKLSDTGLW